MAPASRPTTIQSLDVAPLDMPLRAPFGISRGALAHAANVLVRVTLKDGTQGHGEAAPFPAYNGETQQGTLAALRRVAGQLVGSDASDWKAVGSRFRASAGPACGSALCALEMALLDAVTRSGATPLWRFFGNAGAELDTDMTVTTGSPGEAAEAAEAIRRRGIRTIKVKVGGSPGGAAPDLARIGAILAAAPDSPLILDGNAGMGRAQASELAGGLKALGVAPILLEQWLARDDLEGMRALGADTGWSVAADESVASADDARRVARSRAAQVINVKLMKDGISGALEVVQVARAEGLGLMIGGNVESILAMTASACFASGLGGFAYADLDTPFFLAENPFRGGFHMDGSRISVAHIERGHGVVPAGLLF